METKDNLNFNWTLSNEMSVGATKPFLKKEKIFIIDNNGYSDYSRNQSQFESISIANSGKWADYRNAYIAMGVVVLVQSNKDLGSDPVIDIKNNLHFIDSISVDYNNENVVQQNANISPYLNFKQHTTETFQSQHINSHTGYRKDSGYAYNDSVGITHNYTDEVSVNPSFVKSNSFITGTMLKDKGENYFVISDNGLTHTYYYTCIIRLKDFLFFDKMPMTRGSNLKITINFNQGSAYSQYVAVNGAVGAHLKTTASLKGTVMPVFRINKLLPSVANDYENITVSVGGTHEIKQCRLYVPLYTFDPKVQEMYQVMQKKVLYEDCYIRHLKDVKGSFEFVLSNYASRLQRLVIVPILSKNSNGLSQSVSAKHSPFALEPSTCSPFHLKRFNVKLNGINLYSNEYKYGYESFLDEMNGVYGANGNLDETNVCSSMISLRDYNSNFGYIVCDLSRRSQFDDFLSQNVEIFGEIGGDAKSYDFLCYLTIHKDITLELATGAKVQK